MNAIVLLTAGGSHLRVHTTDNGHIAIAVFASDRADIRLTLDVDEATQLSAALAAAALQLETEAA